MYKYQGINFDDVVKNEEENLWSQICTECLKKIKPGNHSLDEGGSGICGVEGCDNEADYYIDFYRQSYSIWIVKEKNDDGTTTSFDVNVWDEDKDTRAEDLEQGHLGSLEIATEVLNKIIDDNLDAIFEIREYIDSTK